MSQFGWIKKLELSGDQDSRNKKGLIEQYIVEGYAPLTIMNEPGKVIDLVPGSPTFGVSLPAHGASFPGADNTTLDMYAVIATNVTTGGALVTEVEARYSNDRRFGSAAPPVSRTTPGNIRDTFQREKLTFTIPFAEKGKISQPGTLIDVDDWTVKSRTVTHTIYKRVKTITLRNFTNAMGLIVAEQNDNLHWFDDSWWAFESGDAIPIDDQDDLFEIEYIWARDPGTQSLGFSTTAGSIATQTVFPGRNWKFDVAGLSPGSRYVRPPHHILVAVFPNGNTQEPPVFEPFRAKSLDEDGWKNLPGLGG